MNAQFAGNMQTQFQNSSMIGTRTPLAESMTGGAMNRAAAIGGPLAMGALGIAGLDPMSIGLRAGMGAYGGGMGMAGAGAVGLGAAGLAGAGVMAAGYVGNQMFTGAQQQQAFNGSMNSTFRFANQYGGQGFTRGGLGDMGGMMRQMTTDQGSMGQMVGFEELGRLASNMGRMGMAQGVRDAKDFSDKFREMIKTVKQIAESMGTSLEEAQKMMGAMRGSGVFGSNNAASFASRVRAGAVAGGMATSELTGMMQVGSQISRMVGGRGRAGAAGGLETLTNIGVAQQMGTLTEEDIYNTTGLTGAEGRRALATRQMEQSAQFLQGSLGRRFLASVAGKGGRLDANSVEEYMGGGVSTNRTTEMYHKNLAKVGRADFIRNEGKLRGAALEQFGGLAPMIAMKGWLEERGYNVNDNDDRAMLFIQRQTGMGNDDATTMLKQLKDLSQNLRQRRISGQDDEYSRNIAERQSNVGLEGYKRKFEKARAEVQASLQQVGASFYESMNELVEGTINSLTGTYVKETRKDVGGAFRSMLGGGAMGAAAASTTFGIGGGGFASKNTVGRLLEGGPSALSTFNDGDAGRYAEAGFAFKGGDLMKHMGMVSDVVGAFSSGGAGLGNAEGVQSQGARARSAFRQAIVDRTIGGYGNDRLAGFGKFLQGQSGKGDLGADELAARFASAGAHEQAQIMAVFSSKGGASYDQSDYFKDPGMKGIYGTSKYNTVGQGEEDIGKAFFGTDPAEEAKRAASAAAMGGQAAALGLGSGLSMPMTDGRARGVGRYLKSDEGRDLISRMMNDNETIRKDAREQTEKDMVTLRDKKDRSSDENSKLLGLKGALAAQRMTDLEITGASPEQVDAAVQSMSKEYGLTTDEVRSSAKTINTLSLMNKGSARDQAAERYGAEARKDMTALTGTGGIATSEGGKIQLSSAFLSSLGKGDTASRGFMESVLRQRQAMAKMGPGADNDGLLKQVNDEAQKQGGLDMSVAEQKRLAQSLVGVEGMEGTVSDLRRSAGIGDQITAGKERKGALGTAAGLFGQDISKEDINALLKKGGVGAVAKRIAEGLGGGLDKNEHFMANLMTGLTDIKGDKIGKGSKELANLVDNNPEVRKALHAQQEDKDNKDPDKNLEKIRGFTESMATSAKNSEGYLATMAGAKPKPEGKAA